MADTKAFYLTTPIYYVNDAPHIGHAYTTVAGDVLTRWHRQRGEKVWFLTGTDEHGQKVLRSAEANATDPQDWVDKLVRESWLPVLNVIDVKNDDFIRTTEERHIQRVQRFLTRLKDAGWIYEGTYQGPYCVGCEEFKLPADLIEGVDEYKGQQCCPMHSKPIEIVDETNWFFKLSAFTEPLIEHYTNNPEAIRPQSAYNEVMSFIKQGLQDLSISRSTFSWGIDVPWDANQVVYVWFDALLNYATAVGLDDEPGSEGATKFAKTWPADVHLVGKDILRFHAVIWPAMLMAGELALPRCVYAHGWLLVGGEKMSKSKLTGIAPRQIVDHFGSDVFRYYFLKAIQFGQDGSFSWEDLSARYTADLANGLGNLASRATAMVNKYCEGVLPTPGNLTDKEVLLKDLLQKTVADADRHMVNLDFAEGINAVKEFIDAVNLYVTEREPWKVAKDPAQLADLHTILYTIIDCLRAIAILYHPIMPKSMNSLWSQLGVPGVLSEQTVTSAANWQSTKPGIKVTKGDALFPRLEDE
ncbi:MAG: methionine--tRNA ligase [Candidatus Nanopelagicales bacterium]